MSREIKFKYIWSNPTKTHFLSKIFTLDEIESGEQFMVLENEPLLKNYRRVAILQWTGLIDKNGKEIFESDVVSVCFNGKVKNCWEAVVEWCKINPSFFLKKVNPPFLLLDEYDFVKCELLELLVIGNIYENPELITEVKNG